MFIALKLLSPLFIRPRAATETAAPAVPSDAVEASKPAGDEPQAGCGWYDSSHDLSRGLMVREGVSAAELPLSNWLEIELAGWRAAPQPA